MARANTSTISRLDGLHKTKQGLIFFGLVEALVAYIFASLALESGSILQWILTIVFGVGAVQNFVKAAAKLFRKG